MTKIIICPSSLQTRDPILYGAADNKGDVSIFTCDKVSELPSLDGKTDITHIAFMYHMRASKSIPIEDDVNVTQYDDSGNPVGTEYDESGDIIGMPSENTDGDYRLFNKGIIDWVTKMKETNASLEFIDLLTCNIPNAIGDAERTIVANETGLTLRYSLDQTGNSPNGNWVLESDSVDVKSLYFTDDVDNWTDVLDNKLELSTASIVDTITDGSKTIYRLKNDINISTLVTDGHITDAAEFYMHIAEDEIFDGSGHTIDCDKANVTRISSLFTVETISIAGTEPVEITDAMLENFPTIRNVDITNVKFNANNESIVLPSSSFTFHIDNVNIDSVTIGPSSDDTNVYMSGYVGSNSAGFKVQNCTLGMTLDKEFRVGGITGKDSSLYKIYNCNSNIALSKSRGGSIAGYSNGKQLLDNKEYYLSDTLYTNKKFRIIIDECKHNGTTSTSSGGIVSSSFGTHASNTYNVDNYIIKNCENSGYTHNNSGGIVGFDIAVPNVDGITSDVNIYIINCHHIAGTVSQSSGGIVGGTYNSTRAQNRNIHVEIKGCTNKGVMSSGHPSTLSYSQGGIAPKRFGCQRNQTFLIENCANYGNVCVNSGGIIGISHSYQNDKSISERVISNCVNYGEVGCASVTTVTSGHKLNGYAGGITGPNSHANNMLILNCVNYGSLQYMRTGGICGGITRENSYAYVNNTTTKLEIKHCVNKSDIEEDECGGIIASGQEVENGVKYNADVDYTSDLQDANAARSPIIIDHCVNEGTLSSGKTGAGQIAGHKLYNVTVRRTVIPGNDRFSASYDYSDNSDNPNPNAI